MTIKICPLCAEGHLNQSSYTCNVEYRGIKKDLTFSMHLCNICGGDMACNGDLNHNKTGVIFQKIPCDVPDNQWWYKIKFDDSNLSSYTFLKHEFITIQE